MEQELLDLNGLDQKILGSGLDGPPAGVEVVKSTNGKNGEERVRRALTTEGFQHPIPVETRHADIKGDEIGIGGLQIGGGLERVGELLRTPVAGRLKRPAKEPGHAGLVVNDHNMGFCVCLRFHVLDLSCPHGRGAGGRSRPSPGESSLRGNRHGGGRGPTV